MEMAAVSRVAAESYDAMRLRGSFSSLTRVSSNFNNSCQKNPWILEFIQKQNKRSKMRDVFSATTSADDESATGASSSILRAPPSSGRNRLLTRRKRRKKEENI